jgi:Pyruvate/2-oxoacid:ferredoxin oxidoreductase delta subunit
LKPVLDERKCPAQKTCPAIPACTEKAILFIEDASLPLKGRIVFDTEKCNACGDCVAACCGTAITFMMAVVG